MSTEQALALALLAMTDYPEDRGELGSEMYEARRVVNWLLQQERGAPSKRDDLSVRPSNLGMVEP